MEQAELERIIEAILFAAGEPVETQRLAMAAECDTDELMMATIYAAQGITTYLHSFFEKILK